MTRCSLRRLVVLLLLAARVHADRPATTLLAFMDSTRSRALGGAGAAVAGDPALLWRTPASLGGIADRALVMAGSRGILGDQTWMGEVVAPVSRGATAAAGLAYYDAGTLSLRTDAGDVSRVNAQSDVLVALGLGLERGPVAAGAAVKALRSELVEQFAVQAAALDLGIQAALGSRLRIGVALSNAGGALRYRRSEVALPAVVAAGAALSAPPGWFGAAPEDRVTLLAEGAAGWHAGGGEWRAGAEYAWRGRAALRAGWMRAQPGGATAWTVGLGLAAGWFRLDYATRFGGEAAAPHDASLTVRW